MKGQTEETNHLALLLDGEPAPVVYFKRVGRRLIDGLEASELLAPAAFQHPRRRLPGGGLADFAQVVNFSLVDRLAQSACERRIAAPPGSDDRNRYADAVAASFSDAPTLTQA